MREFTACNKFYEIKKLDVPFLSQISEILPNMSNDLGELKKIEIFALYFLGGLD